MHKLHVVCRNIDFALDSAFRGLLFSDPAGDRNAARLRYEAVCEERAREIETETSRVACALDALGDFLTDLLRRQEFTPEGWMNSYYDNNAEPVRRMMRSGFPRSFPSYDVFLRTVYNLILTCVHHSFIFQIHDCGL